METTQEGVSAPPHEAIRGETESLQHLFVMRHGDRWDDANRSWVHSAPRPWDPPLTDQGKRRARDVGIKLRNEGWNITRVFCSPFLRCAQTASEVVAALCALDDIDNTSHETSALDIAIDPSRVKVPPNLLHSGGICVCLYVWREILPGERFFNSYVHDFSTCVYIVNRG